MKQEAKNCVMLYALGASGACGFFKLIVPIPFVEVVALTAVTKKMCKEITSIYGYSSIDGMGTLFGVAVGAFSGAKLATGILDIIPGLGAGANAIATYSLHTLTGFSLILICELLKDGKIKESDIRDSSLSVINIVAKISTSLIGGFLRGDLNDSIAAGKRAFKWSSTDTDIDAIKSDIKTIGKDVVSVGTGTTIDVIEIKREKSNNEENPLYINFISNSNVDVVEYYTTIHHIYETRIGTISQHSTLQSVLNECGKIYGQIFDLNLKYNIWNSRDRFDHFLSFVIAGQVKEKVNNSHIKHLTQEIFADKITKNIFKYLDGEKNAS